MFDLTYEDVVKATSNWEKILERAEEVGNEIGFFNAEYDSYESEKTTINIEKGVVCITAYDSHYDMYDYDWTNFPISYLFEDAEKHKNIYKINKQKMEEECKKREEERKREAELKELQRLKEKYE